MNQKWIKSLIIISKNKKLEKKVQEVFMIEYEYKNDYQL